MWLCCIGREMRDDMDDAHTPIIHMCVIENKYTESMNVE